MSPSGRVLRFPCTFFDLQSDQDVGASANCRLGVRAVMLVASRTELIHHGQIVERLRPPPQGSGCIPDRAIGRVRPDNLYEHRLFIPDRFSTVGNAQTPERLDELILRCKVQVNAMPNHGNEIDTRICRRSLDRKRILGADLVQENLS